MVPDLGGDDFPPLHSTVRSSSWAKQVEEEEILDVDDDEGEVPQEKEGIKEKKAPNGGDHGKA